MRTNDERRTSAATSNTVWIVWGESSTIAENGEDMISEYAFDTLAELNAFLLGVSERDDWLCYEQYDSLEAAKAYVKEQQ